MEKYAHQRLAEKAIKWCRVERALAEYPHIANHFCVRELQQKAPFPYFCHYLAWRMSTSHGYVAGDSPLALFDCLIAEAKNLPGWDRKRLKDSSYKSFWSLLWELQVAEAFTRCPAVRGVQWLPHGPDLRIDVGGQECFAECYVYMKSCADREYIRDLLNEIDPHFQVRHRISVPMRLPTGQKLVEFLHELFEPFLDGGGFLAKLKDKARREGRADISIPQGACNLEIYLTDPQTSPPPDPKSAQGAGAFFGKGFVVDAVKKAVQNKTDRNALASNHPNVLLVNCLLPEDYLGDLGQTLTFYGGKLPDCALTKAKGALDAACFFAHGVDRRLCLDSGHAVYSDRSCHPLAGILSARDCGDDC